MVGMWYKIQNQQVHLFILAKPNAKKTLLTKITEEGLHIALQAKPHDGEANKVLISYLAKLFRLPKSQIVLKRGEASRYKHVLLPLTSVVQQFFENPIELLSL